MRIQCQTKYVVPPLAPLLVLTTENTVYLTPIQGGVIGWPGDVIVDGRPTVEKMIKALEETPYGICVYESANDVLDHQTVSIQYSSPVDDAPSSKPPHTTDDGGDHLPPVNPTVSFTISAHTESISMRKTTLYFEHGEVIGDFSTYTVSDFRDTGAAVKRVIPPYQKGGGHAGGDWGLTDAWLKAVKEHEAGQTVQALGVGAKVRDQLRVFLTGFAIEEARKGLKVVDLQEFEQEMMARYENRSHLARVAVEYEPERPLSSS